MTTYARFRGLLETSDTATYVSVREHELSVDLTPDKQVVRVAVNAGVSGDSLTLSLTHMTTITLLLVEHGGAAGSADVTVSWDSLGGDNCTAVLSAGGPPLITPDMDPTSLVGLDLESADATTPRVLISYTGT